MNDPTPNDVGRATAILDGSDASSPKEVLELSKRLTKHGEPNLARQLRARARTVDVDEAIEILSRKESDPIPDPITLLSLAKRLMGYKEIGYARRVLKIAREDLRKTGFPKEYLEIFQKSALYTYKDPDLPQSWRLDRALEILKEPEDLAVTVNQETLGLAGAIHKRKWEVDSQRQNLELSLLYYKRGYAQGCAGDQGYTGINAAFVLDLLAYQEARAAELANDRASETDNKRRQEARDIRQTIVETVPGLTEQDATRWLKNEWWFYSTVGEAYFGLGKYEEAVAWLVEKPAKEDLHVPEWEYESTARQLAALARLQMPNAVSEADFEQTDAWQALRKFLGNDANAVRSAFTGKLGLALSGGGFRASLFHIGTLARLAELGMLRRVEALSCVSGGSIIGAHYYLEIRRLLETRTDQEISPDDYIEIVQRIEKGFLEGVQKNIRTRVLAEFTTNLKMIFYPGYSRTMRAGELYEREIFSKVEDRPEKEKDKERWLNELRICPSIDKNQKQVDFSPKNHNWRRKNKVPILILNTTTLNTGHSWHFTATYMGESPAGIASEIDSNYRLRRMYYEHAPEKPKNHRQIRLGHAVAASACVPGIFEPLALNELYPDRSVQLVDGGVCDNQGIAGLLEQDCAVMLVSDGSGQMESQDRPSRGLLGVPLRSSSISQARVREAQYHDLSARRRSGLLRGLLFVHLKQDLGLDSVNWKDCPAHFRISDFEQNSAGQKDETPYGLAKDIQKRLAGIRTDLDSFCDVEAYALMTSAYRMTEHAIKESKFLSGLAAPEKKVKWKFLGIEADMKPGSARKEPLERLLGISSYSAFKIWRLCPVLKGGAIACATLLVILAALACYVWPDASIIPGWLSRRMTLGRVGLAILALSGVSVATAALASFVGERLGRSVIRLVRWRDTLRQIAIGVAMCFAGWIIAQVHLRIFDRVYLCYGSLKHFHK